MCWVLWAQRGQWTHPGPTLEAHCLLPGSRLLWASWLPLRQVRWAMWSLQQDVSRTDGHPPGEGSGQVLPPSPRQPPPLQSAQGMVEPREGQPGSLIFVEEATSQSAAPFASWAVSPHWCVLVAAIINKTGTVSADLELSRYTVIQ